MTFSESVRINLGPKYLFRIRGRASRSEYWWFTLFTILVGMAEQAAGLFLPPMILWVVSTCVSLALLPPSVGVTVRRLHDVNLSGLWLLLPIFFPPLAGFLILGDPSPGMATFIIALIALFGIAFLVLMCWSGKPFPNRFGNPPADQYAQAV